uniref:Uncharacterized protein n=1 Tax=Pundamilia nyererei TaxID=303518 RepID=A0A3B4FVM3_9CICH
MRDYEGSIAYLGIWGWYQVKVIFFLCTLSFPAGYNILSVIFLLAIPPHQCYIPAHSNLSQDWIQASIPIQVRTSGSSRFNKSLPLCSSRRLLQVKHLEKKNTSSAGPNI